MSDKNCLDVLCTGCKRVVKYCLLSDHIKNECNALQLLCIYHYLGCKTVIPIASYLFHLEHSCRFRPKRPLCNCSSNQIYVKEEMPEQCLEHCSVCTSGNCYFSDSCPMVRCDKNCGSVMHKCKLMDHSENICQEQEVFCVSHAYGCTKKIKRYELGNHLKNCSASVIHCGFQWNRNISNWKLYQTSLDSSLESVESRRRLLKALSSQMPYVYRNKVGGAFVLRDQFQFARKLERINNRVLTNYFTKNSSSTDGTKSITYEEEMSSTSLSGRSSAEISNWHKSNLMDFGDSLDENNVWDDQDNEKVDKGFDKDDLKCVLEECGIVRTECNFNVGHDSKTKDQEQVGHLVMKFSCDNVVHRSQWAAHAFSHWRFWHMGSSDWLEARCPLSVWGCAFRVSRFSGIGGCDDSYEDSLLGFHPGQSSFCLLGGKYDSIDASGDNSNCGDAPIAISTSRNGTNLDNLPTELLLRIMSRYLDSFSCSQLAKVSLRFFQIHQTLPSANYVSLHWTCTRTNGGHIRWRPCVGKVCVSPQGLSANDSDYHIRFYAVSREIQSHLRNCQYWGERPCCPVQALPKFPDTILCQRD